MWITFSHAKSPIFRTHNVEISNFYKNNYSFLSIRHFQMSLIYTKKFIHTATKQLQKTINPTKRLIANNLHPIIFSKNHLSMFFCLLLYTFDTFICLNKFLVTISKLRRIHEKRIITKLHRALMTIIIPLPC